MTYQIVTVSPSILRGPPRHPRYIAVPRDESLPVKEIGVFSVIVRSRDLHGVIVLFLGGRPSAYDAQTFLAKNPALLPADDTVVVGCEMLDTIDEAIAYAAVISNRRAGGTYQPQNVFFFANVEVAK